MRKQGRGKGMRDGRREQQAEDKRGAVTDKEGWKVKGEMELAMQSERREHTEREIK